MNIKHLDYIQLPVAELVCASKELPPRRLKFILRRLCEAATIDYFMAVRADFSFQRGDNHFKPKNACEGHFWAKARHINKKMFLKKNKMKYFIR